VNVRGLTDLIRRPWSKPTLVLVTALVAGLAGYGVAATRPKEAPPVAEPSMRVENWLSEMERVPAVEAVGEPAEKALKAAPGGVEVLVKTVVVQNPYAMSGSGLLALPAGEWAVYASCRVDEAADVPDGFKAGLNISGGQADEYAELACPTDARRPLAVLRPTADTVYSFMLTPFSDDLEDDDFWEVSMAAGVFIAAV